MVGFKCPYPNQIIINVNFLKVDSHLENFRGEIGKIPWVLPKFRGLDNSAANLALSYKSQSSINSGSSNICWVWYYP